MKNHGSIGLKKSFGLLMALSWIVAMASGLVGCARVVIPENDRTPPTVALHFGHEGVEAISGGDELTVPVTDFTRETLMVSGTDTDGGVRRVWIEGSVRIGCGSSVTNRPHNSEINRQEGDAGDSVRPTLAQVLSWRTSAWLEYEECSPADPTHRLGADYVGYVQNFSGAIARTPTLRLVYVNSSEWVRLMGITEAWSAQGIAVDTSGSVYITGSTMGGLAGFRNAGEKDIYFIKYDANGNRRWAKLYGTAGSDFGKGVALDTYGNAYITGTTYGDLDGNENQGASDVFLSKYNRDGERLWTRLLGTAAFDTSYDIAADNSGNVYITGGSSGDLDGNVNRGVKDVFVAKYNSDGIRQWTRLYGSRGREDGLGIAVDASGNAYITGYTEGNMGGHPNAGGEGDNFILKYDADGNWLWVRLFGTEEKEAGHGIAVDNRGNAFITGFTKGDLAGLPNSRNDDIFVAKYDTDGNRGWTRLLGTARSSDVGLDIAVDTGGYVYFTGAVGGDLDGNVNQGLTDVFLSKYNRDGDRLWTRLLGSPENESGSCIAVDASGNVVVTGTTSGNLGGNDIEGIRDAFIWRFPGRYTSE